MSLLHVGAEKEVEGTSAEVVQRAVEGKDVAEMEVVGVVIEEVEVEVEVEVAMGTREVGVVPVMEGARKAKVGWVEENKEVMVGIP